MTLIYFKALLRRLKRAFSSVASWRFSWNAWLSYSWFSNSAIFFFKYRALVSASDLVPTMTPFITRRILQKRANTINAENWYRWVLEDFGRLGIQGNLQIAWWTMASKNKTMSIDQATITFNRIIKIQLGYLFIEFYNLSSCLSILIDHFQIFVSTFITSLRFDYILQSLPNRYINK